MGTVYYLLKFLCRLAAAVSAEGGARAAACTGRRGKKNIEILAGLTEMLQRELRPENNSTYSVLVCVPSPYVCLFVCLFLPVILENLMYKWT